MSCNRASWLAMALPGLWVIAGCGGPAPEPPAARAPVSTARSAAVLPAPVRFESEPPRVRLIHVRPVPFADAVGGLPPGRPVAYVEETQSVLRTTSGLPADDTSTTTPSPAAKTPADSSIVFRRATSGTSEPEPKPVERLKIDGSSPSSAHVAHDAVVQKPVKKPTVSDMQNPAANVPGSKSELHFSLDVPAPSTQTSTPSAAASAPKPQMQPKPSEPVKTVIREPDPATPKLAERHPSISSGAAEIVKEAPIELHVAPAAPKPAEAHASPSSVEPKIVSDAPTELHIAIAPAKPQDQPVSAVPKVASPAPEPQIAAEPVEQPQMPQVVLEPPREQPQVRSAPQIHHAELADTPAESERLESGRPDLTPELLAICKRAEIINRRGYEMAQRGAIFSARQDYLQSLQTVAEALDAQRGTRAHQRMLAAGFRALDEADDFAAIDIGSGAQLDIASIASVHQTPVIKDEPHDNWSAQAAMGRYLTYAQEQLAGAVGEIPQASAALFGLGKVYSVPAGAHGPKDLTGGAKAVTFYQAALMVDGRNFMAANELGVALVQFGRLPEARAALLHSLSISSQPVAWQNLAAIHQMLGENKLAEQARQSATVAANQSGKGVPALSTFDVQWVDTATFARSMPVEADPIKPVQTTAAQQPPQPAQQQPQHKSLADVLPWSSSSRRQ